MEAQQTFTQNGTVWAVTTSQWSGMDSLTPEDLGLRPEDVPADFNLGQKPLIPADLRIKLRQTPGRVQGFMAGIGQSFFLRGCWFIPDKNLLLADDGIRRIEQDQSATVEMFLDRYEEIKAQRIQDKPYLARAQWPSPDQIRAKFRVKKVVFQILGATSSGADPADLIEAKARFNRELREAYDDLKEEILKEAHAAIIEACEEIREKITTGGAISETNLKKPRKVIEQYENVASLFDLPEIKSKVEEIKGLTESATAKQLRERPFVAQAFAESLKTLGADLGDLSGYSSDGRLKRKIDLGGEREAA